MPIGYKTNVAGSHSISLNNTDGLFIDQDIYIHDKDLDIVHDLKVSNYEFATLIGTFNDRFEIVYINSTLDNPDNTTQKGIVVYNQENTVHIKSPLEEISRVKVIDMQGRVLYNLKEVNSNQAFLELDLPNQVLIISVTMKNGTAYNKKIIH